MPSSADRKSTRLNSSHCSISYAVFCLKKKNTRLKSSHVQLPHAGTCSHNSTPRRVGVSVVVVDGWRRPDRALCSVLLFFFFFLRIRRPPRSPLFPSPALFRSRDHVGSPRLDALGDPLRFDHQRASRRDRKSTRLNSSHGSISYAVFCLKKK